MFKYTNYLLHKLEALFSELDYTIRYEKGTFQSGYCVVDQQKIVVINKFYATEARINCLLEILDQITFDASGLSEDAGKTFKKIKSVLTTAVESDS